MPSTVTTPVATRVSREDADALHEIARELDVTPSTVAAGLMRYALHGERRERVLDAIQTLKQAQDVPPGSRAWRRYVLQAIECLDDRAPVGGVALHKKNGAADAR